MTQQCPICGGFLPRPPTHCPKCRTEFDCPPEKEEECPKA